MQVSGSTCGQIWGIHVSYDQKLGCARRSWGHDEGATWSDGQQWSEKTGRCRDVRRHHSWKVSARRASADQGWNS